MDTPLTRLLKSTRKGAKLNQYQIKEMKNLHQRLLIAEIRIFYTKFINLYHVWVEKEFLPKGYDFPITGSAWCEEEMPFSLRKGYTVIGCTKIPDEVEAVKQALRIIVTRPDKFRVSFYPAKFLPKRIIVDDF